VTQRLEAESQQPERRRQLEGPRRVQEPEKQQVLEEPLAEKEQALGWMRGLQALGPRWTPT
jgi:hypothetical protein